MYRLYRVLPLCLLLASFGLTGCNRAGRDVSELRDPLIRQAHARLREGNKDMALEILNRALFRKPDLAQAHLDAALLYDDYRRDYIRAIYHYNRYLELRPKAEKRDMIEDLTRKARMSYAAGLVDQDLKLDHRVRQLREENARLRVELREVRANLARLNLVERGVSPPPVPAAEAADPEKRLEAVPMAEGIAPVKVSEELYTVQPGDTLSVIAGRVYQDPRKWPLIFEANRKLLASPEKLRVGQKLKTPPLDADIQLQQRY